MKSPARIALGRNIKKVRLEKGLTQEELASLTGIDYKYIQKIESKNPPSLRIDTIEKIAKALRVSISRLTDL